MYPGEYEVDIIPPIESRYRLSRLTATVDGINALEFRPQPRTTVTGRVQTADERRSAVHGLKSPSFVHCLPTRALSVRLSSLPPERSLPKQTITEDLFCNWTKESKGQQ